MKKLLIFTLTLSLLFAAGCKKETSSNNTTNTQEIPTQQITPQETTPNETSPQETPVIAQKPMYAISLTPQAEETVDEKGAVRFRYSYQNIALIMPEPSVAERIILDFHNRMDKADQYAETIRAESMRAEYDTLGTALLNYVEYTPARFDPGVLSLNINHMVYLGGVHPDYIGTSVTYDLLTGNVLKLSDILNSNINLDNLANMIVTKLAANEGLWPNYEEIIAETFASGLDTCEIWYFNNNGLCFRYDPYLLAPYAAGSITAEIPYSELTGILRDEYFPAEQDSSKGSLIVENFTTTALSDFTQFAETVLIDNGTKILLSADGAITDITIQTVSVETGSSDISGETIMAIQSLTPGDAIMIEFDSSTTKLLVNYRNGDQYETETISYSDNNLSIS